MDSENKDIFKIVGKGDDRRIEISAPLEVYAWLEEDPSYTPPPLEPLDINKIAEKMRSPDVMEMIKRFKEDIYKREINRLEDIYSRYKHEGNCTKFTQGPCPIHFPKKLKVFKRRVAKLKGEYDISN